MNKERGIDQLRSRVNFDVMNGKQTVHVIRIARKPKPPTLFDKLPKVIKNVVYEAKTRWKYGDF